MLSKRPTPRLRWIAAAIALVTLGATAHAGGGPQNVFLVVNARGAKSKEVANHYIALRHIPPINVFYVPAPPNAVRMTGNDFRDKILRPTLEEIDRRKLSAHIDQIVYSCEFPFIIDCSMLVGLPNVPGQNRPVASLTGATYLYQFILSANDNLAQLNTNFYFSPMVDGKVESRVFRGRQQWMNGGLPVATGGLRYVLATQLGCSQPEGNTVAEMISYLRLAAEADGMRPPGTFFYMKNNDVRSRARHELNEFAPAVAAIRALGLKAEIANGIVPPATQGVAGLTTGAIHVPLRNQLAPGALVDNLTSAGGVLTRVANPKPQTRISEFLRLGAAGASGTVIEPFAMHPKFPSAALHVHYARGCTMAESFYQSVQGPWQLLILGDPLCQPWAHIPEVAVSGVERDAVISGTLQIMPTAAMTEDRTVRRFELYVDGRPRGERKPGQKFSLDTTQLGDGHHELRVIAVEDTPIETEGSWIADVMVKNGTDAVSITSPGGSSISGAQLSLNVTATIEGTTAILHNGRELGRVTGRQGTLTTPTEKLGRGPVVLEARMIGERGVRSRPLTLEIQ